MKSKYDAIFESMDEKDAAEWSKDNPEKIKFMQEIKKEKEQPQKDMETYVKNTTANNANPNSFKKLVAQDEAEAMEKSCLLYTSPSPRDGLLSRMPSSA